MFGTLLGSSVDADAAYAERVSARLRLERDGLDEDGLRVLKAVREIDDGSLIIDADDELIHRVIVTITEDYGTSATYVRRAKKCCERLLKILSWRRTLGADAIVSAVLPSSEEFHTHWPTFLAGADDHGHPVLVERVNDVNAEGLLGSMTTEQVTAHRVQIMKALDKFKRRKDCTGQVGSSRWEKTSNTTETKDQRKTRTLRKNNIHKQCMLIDLSNVSASGLLFSDTKRRLFLFSLPEMLTDKYPDTLHCAWIVNAPYSFRATWVTLRQVLNQNTVEKISVLGVDAGDEKLARKFKKTGINSNSTLGVILKIAKGTDPGTLPGVVRADELIEDMRGKVEEQKNLEGV